MGFVDFLWFLLFALLAAWSVRLSRKILGFWFTPLSVFVGINCTSLCAYHLRLLPMNDVSAITHLLVVLSLLMFVWGAHLAASRMPAAAVPLVAGKFDATGLPAFFYTTAVLATVGWLLAMLILVGRYGLTSLFANIWLLQDEFQMQFIGYLNMIGILVLPTYVLRRSSDRFRWLDMLLVGSAIWGLTLAGIKAYLVYSSLAAMMCWSVVSPQRFRPRVLVAGLLALLVFFIVYTSKIDLFVAKIYTGGGFFADLPALHRPYIYFVGSWPAMDDLVHGKLPPSEQFASVTLFPLWKVLGDGLGLIKPVPFALPFSDIGTTLFNVYSFFGEVYRDWKWPGPPLVSWLLGFVSTRLYLRTRRRGYWGQVLVYSLVGYGVFLSCFVYAFGFNMLVMLMYLYVYGFVILRGGVLIDRRRDG
jgi:oligosaccharide repeat unit polymerase